MANSWGKIMVGVRLEKTVPDQFFRAWTNLLAGGLRHGDKYAIAQGMIAHRAANFLVRALLKSDCDTLAFLDSDADIEQDFIERFREHVPGQDYDILQAFYTRRGWPPDAIWVKRDEAGKLQSCFVLDETTEDVAVIGLHACLVRRAVFERMVGDADPEKFDFFYYPRHSIETEDVAFSQDAAALGFRIGATTAVKAGHISQVTLGWETYQDYLMTSGQMEGIENYNTLVPLIAVFTNQSDMQVVTRAASGSQNVSAAWGELNPQGADETRAFYGAANNGYLYDLLHWNASKTYVQIVRPLRGVHDASALVIGGGLGVEADILRQGNNSVWIFELPGVLRDFLTYRGMKVLDEDRIEHVAGVYDLVVAIDVLEHIHPDEIDVALEAINNLLVPGGVLYAHNNFGQQDLYPMHFDHSAAFAAWIERHGYQQDGALTWRKPNESAVAL